MGKNPWDGKVYKLSAVFAHIVGSHVFSAAEYPFQDTRYCLRPCVLWCKRILSILYSSSPLIQSSGGLEKFGPCSGVFL